MSEDIDFGQPVDEGDKVVVTIEDMGSKGDGITRINGFVIFVPETEIGETVEIEIENVGSKFAFAKVIDRDVEEKDEEDEEYEEDLEESYEEDDYEKEELDDEEPLEEEEELDDEGSEKPVEQNEYYYG